MEITKPFRRNYGIYLNLMKEFWNFTTCDRLALETPLGSELTMHAQKTPWILDARHVDYLNEVKLL
jgi:hypothetical protein